MVKRVLTNLDEICAQLDALAEQARAISKKVIAISKPSPIRALTGAPRRRRRGKSESPRLTDC
jgi:hypothetical protein